MVRNVADLLRGVTARGLRCIHAAYCCWRRRSQPAPIRRILVVKLDALGDVILASAFFRELARSFPDAHITAVVSPSTVALMEHCPWVQRLLTFFPSPGKSAHARRIHAYWFAIRHLWPAGFDLAILPRWDRDYYLATVLLCASGAKKIAAWTRAFATFPGGILARAELRHAALCTGSSPVHEVLRGLKLLEAAGGAAAETHTEVWLHDSDRLAVDRWLAAREVDDRPLIAFGIGAADVERRWPAVFFAELANRVWMAGVGRPVLVGHGNSDSAVADRIIELCHDAAPVNAVGVFTVRQTCALLEHCLTFIGNDSGPMHMAAAVGLPVVEISGLPAGADPNSAFSPKRFGPWGVPARVVQPVTPRAGAADDLGCLEIAAVHVDEVFQELVSVLRDGIIDAPVPGDQSIKGAANKRGALAASTRMN